MPPQLTHPDTMAMDMDIGMDIDQHQPYYVTENDDEAVLFSCVECGRRVCDTCSVRDGGESRMCLGCAMDGNNGGGMGGKRWVGGIGWM